MEVYVVGVLKFQKAHFVEGGMLKSSGEAPRAIPSIGYHDNLREWATSK